MIYQVITHSLIYCNHLVLCESNNIKDMTDKPWSNNGNLYIIMVMKELIYNSYVNKKL